VAAFRHNNPAASSAAIEAFRHALLVGRMPGRFEAAAQTAICLVPFNAGPYLEANPDLIDAGVNPIDDILNHGMSEKRRLRLRGSTHPDDDGGPKLRLIRNSICKPAVTSNRPAQILRTIT
jgi:hypothetical protein